MPPDEPTPKARLADVLFGDVIQAAVTAAISARVADDPGWHPLHPSGPHDRDYADWLQDQTDALEAWRKNLTMRRVVTLTRSYVLGGGITLGSKHPWVNKIILDFGRHPENQLERVVSAYSVAVSATAPGVRDEGFRGPGGIAELRG